MSDEFMLSTTPPTEQEVDQRRVFENNGTVYDMFHNLHRARAAAEAAAAALRELRAEPDADNFIGEMLSLAGFTYLYFGESFCSGVPFSHLEGDEVVYGAPQTTDEMFQTAVARFDAALAEPGVLLELDPESGWSRRSPTWPPWARAGPCWTADCSRRRPPRWSTCPPSSST